MKTDREIDPIDHALRSTTVSTVYGTGRSTGKIRRVEKTSVFG